MLELLAVVALQTATLPNAVPLVKVSAQQPSQASLALTVAQLSYPRESLPVAQDSYMRDFANNIVKTPQGARIEQRFPGFALRFSKAAQIVTRRSLYARLPELHRQLSKYYAANLSAEEMEQAIAFLSSRAAKQIVLGTSSNIDVGSLILNHSAEGKTQVMDRAAAQAFAGLSPSEVAESSAFLKSPVGRRMVELGAGARVIAQAWTDSDSSLKSKIEALPMNIIREMSARKR